MKGALMKVGQLASFVDDGMPEPVRVALGQLQQDAPPMSGDLAAEVVERELGADPERLFLEWDPVPIAAASIGQVHRAITRDERAVAVKVQYPGVEEAIRADLDNMDLAAVVMPFVWGSLDVRGMTEEIRSRLQEELDYDGEAANQRRFAAWYRDHPFIHIPEVVDELSTRRVLTSELAEGVRFTELEQWDQDERSLAAEAIYRFVFRSLYRFHAFNGDPHPGNYLFRPGGQVTFLDFGLVKYFSSDDIADLLRMVRPAVVEPNAKELRRAAEDAGHYVRGAPISDEVVAEYSSMFWKLLLEDEVKTITSEYASDLTRHLLFAHQEFPEVMKYGNVPPRYLVLQRINVGLVAILGRLNATANWRRVAWELWPITDGPPSTELGRQEAAWWAEARTRAPLAPAV
jgi:predicted unusual protein kinase regulating ubiquinone biosynthesis (AarF/ABC1/UbiB family)